MEKIKKILSMLKLYRDIKSADVGAEKAGAARFLKVLLASLVVVMVQAVVSQSGEGCVLGPTACSLLANPSLSGLLVAALVGLEKWLNEKYGLGIQPLDTAKR